MSTNVNREINYSVIIPHKNTPKLLQRCLDSIPRRKDLQIIVIDDYSEPEKVNFEHFPGLKDPFVEVVLTKEGKGAGYARNIGLTKAVGKWLLFADSDDFYNYCINDILDEYINSCADIVYFKHNSLDSDDYCTAFRNIDFNKRVSKWLASASKNDTLLRYRHSVVWSKLFKKELIDKNSIIFDEVSISNDTTFAYLTGFYAKSISADPRALYCSTIKQGSIRLKDRNEDNKLDQFYVHCKRCRFLKSHNISLWIQLAENFPLARRLIIFYFSNKNHYNKAKSILKDFGYTSQDILIFVIYEILIITPKILLEKIIILAKRKGKIN